MKIGLIGLGKMGNNMSVRLMKDGHRVVVYDLNQEVLKELEGKGAVRATDAALMSKADCFKPPSISQIASGFSSARLAGSL